jgi:hypothetical protein
MKAASFEVLPAARPAATLADFWPIKTGGLAIEEQPASGGNPPGGNCTMGFITRRQGVLGFVTNAHCSGVIGSLDGTVFHQPEIGAGSNRIGVEVVDPPLIVGGVCPTGDACRMTDSVWARLDSGIGANHGYLARPPYGSIQWSGADFFAIRGQASPVIGQIVEHLGRTSGRRAGWVTQINVNVKNTEDNVVMLYQHRSDYVTGPGDSGGPVYDNYAGQDVNLVGLHWGSGGWFSDIQYMQLGNELGPLDFIAAGGGGGR